MALISKTNRCVVCGSSEVVFDKESGLYRCAACGAESKELMPVSDAAAINRIALPGETPAALIPAQVFFFSITRTTLIQRSRPFTSTVGIVFAWLLRPLTPSRRSRRNPPRDLCGG